MMLLAAACGGSDSGRGPYGQILSQPPYAAITDSIRQQPERNDLYFRRAVLLNKNNLPEPALADFKKAWSLAKFESYAVGISNILLEKKPDSAVLFLQDAIAELPNSVLLPLSLVRSYDAMGKTDEALAVCTDLLDREPNQANALLLKADLLEKKKDTAGMIASLEQAQRLVPNNREISYRLAYQYAESKNAKALSLADSLISQDSLGQFADPLYVKGVYYSNTGNRNKALELFNATLKKDHRYLNAYIEKGKIQLDQGQTREALKTFQLANTVTPSFADAWYWIGRCQEALGDKTAAKENYEKAYELDKSFTEAKEAAAKIK